MKKCFYFAVFIFLVLGGFSCQSDNVSFTPAAVRYYDSPALNACGWVLEVVENGVIVPLKPTNLKDNYKIDQLVVEVDFNRTGARETCNFDVFALEVELVFINIIN